jgi:hypothetical protein
MVARRGPDFQDLTGEIFFWRMLDRKGAEMSAEALSIDRRRPI